jgi:predicted PurR-regulated permease PerM
MSDEGKAGMLTIAFAVGLFIGGLIGGAVGAIIAITATLMFAGTLYSSWLIDRTTKRLSRYIKSSGEAIDREINGRKEQRWWI